jgi:predicted Zn-dependent protease
MISIEDDFSSCSALVVDANHTSRAILVGQLRDFGVPTVVQASRTADARRQLEYRTFDFVLCEQHFGTETVSGQDLLDDLRRNQLLPFSTIFIMITGEATYAKVAEAAESALDGYLLKPHKASQLADRLVAARVRKVSLQEIFAAIEAENFEQAAKLCLDRFESRGRFWLYAARVGAELLLRVGRYSEAQTLYQAVVAAKTLPWAKLGVARAQLESGQIKQATSMLEILIGEDPNFTDAYDVLGRAQFELGRFDKALETYKMASMLTPASISRLQSLAMMTFYGGDHVEAEKLLERTVARGIESKMFDCQSLVLLAFARLELTDRKGLQQCQDDFARLLERYPDSARVQRMSEIVVALNLIQKGQFAQVVALIRTLASKVKSADFDFESASNLMALLSHIAHRAIQLEEVDGVVQSIGLRFCSNRSSTELLAASAAVHPAYAESARKCQAIVLEQAEIAMALSLGGKPEAAVKNLVLHGKETLNARLIDNAYQLLQKNAAKIADVTGLTVAVQDLRSRYGQGNGKVSLGEQKRQAGGLALRTGSRPATANPPKGEAPLTA